MKVRESKVGTGLQVKIMGSLEGGEAFVTITSDISQVC